MADNKRKLAELASTILGCGNCHAMKGPDGGQLLHCKRCRLQYYCSRQCQKQHWKLHKPDCKEKSYLPSGYTASRVAIGGNTSAEALQMARVGVVIIPYSSADPADAAYQHGIALSPSPDNVKEADVTAELYKFRDLPVSTAVRLPLMFASVDIEDPEAISHYTEALFLDVDPQSATFGKPD